VNDPAVDLERFLSAIERSVETLPTLHRLGRPAAPDPASLALASDCFRWICFPGYFGPRDGASAGVGPFLGRALRGLVDALKPELERAAALDDGDAGRASGWIAGLLEAIPGIRELLAEDADEAFRADPAAKSVEEIILCYPGLHAVVDHRLAHALHAMNVPLVPRMIAEAAHRRTGIDIHPGASVAGGLFIDHGTGVVIGETTVIGRRCRIYQGVTLGALTPDLGPGRPVSRGAKRHPTLGDQVVVYAGATILGGDTVIGDGTTVNGGVFLTQSVPPGSIVQAPRPELVMKSRA
jgi:serine O-acetyltransferase